MAATIAGLEQEREKLIADIRAEVALNDDGVLSADSDAKIQTMRARHTAAGTELQSLREKEASDAVAARNGIEARGSIDAFLAEQAQVVAPEAIPDNQRADPEKVVKAMLDFRTLSDDVEADRRVVDTLRRQAFISDNPRQSARMDAMPVADQDNLRYLQMGSKQRAIVMGTDAQGGYLVPPNTTLYGLLTEEMKAYMGVNPLMTHIMTDTLAKAPKPGSSENIREATVIAENTAGADRSTPVFRQDEFNPRTVATDRYGVTWQAMRSAGINLQAYIARILGEQLARGCNKYLITGSATASTPEPVGLQNGVTTEVLNGVIGYKVGATQLHYGAYSATSTHHGLAKLLPAVQHGVNIAYRQNTNSAIVMSDQILLQLRTSVSTTGQRLYPELDMPNQMGETRYGGMKILVDPNMPDFAASGSASKMLYVGDFARFWMLDVSGFIFIDDPYTGSLNLTHRYRLAKAFDSEVIDTKAIGFVDVDSVT